MANGNGNGNGQTGNLKWVITTLIAIFAGAGADRLIVEGRLSRMSEQIGQLTALNIADIKAHQVRNEAIIEEHTKEIETLKRLVERSR